MEIAQGKMRHCDKVRTQLKPKAGGFPSHLQLVLLSLSSEKTRQVKTRCICSPLYLKTTNHLEESRKCTASTIHSVGPQILSSVQSSTDLEIKGLNG